jgi:hypothetical protein
LLKKHRLAPDSVLAFIFMERPMPKKAQIFRETDLRRAIRAFQKLGLPIAGAEIHRDGKIVVVVGDGKQESAANDNAGGESWDAALK